MSSDTHTIFLSVEESSLEAFSSLGKSSFTFNNSVVELALVNEATSKLVSTETVLLVGLVSTFVKLSISVLIETFTFDIIVDEVTLIGGSILKGPFTISVLLVSQPVSFVGGSIWSGFNTMAFFFSNSEGTSICHSRRFN